MVRHMVHRMVNDMMHGMVHGMVLAWCASHGVRQAVPRTEVGHVDRHAVHIHAVELAAWQLQRPLLALTCAPSSSQKHFSSLHFHRW